jgi:hypothetical protein
MNEKLTEFKLQHQEKERQKRIEPTGIMGYCGCCGEPHYVNKEIEHNDECIQYEREN